MPDERRRTRRSVAIELYCDDPSAPGPELEAALRALCDALELQIVLSEPDEGPRFFRRERAACDLERAELEGRLRDARDARCFALSCWAR